MGNKTLYIATVVVSVFLACSPVRAQKQNLLNNPGFESDSEKWNTSNPGRYDVLSSASRSGKKGLRYYKEFAETTNENAHYDQLVKVEPDTLYLARAYFKSETWLRPTLRVATMDWETLAFTKAGNSDSWQRAELLFYTGDSEKIRLQIFGGATSHMRGTEPGKSFCDDLLLRKVTSEETKQLMRPKVHVNRTSPIGQMNPLFFGVNTLFWVEDDAALADGEIAGHLRKMPCNLLRYPAGGAAQNYLWKSHRLVEPDEYPKEEGPHTTDTDEFMDFCREVGADPIFVVNLKSGFEQNDVEEAAQRAAEWVRYCNKQNDYDVQFWEIGNETYLHGSVSPMQYASAFNLFAEKMKQVDSDISLGVVGPLTPVATAKKGDVPWWPKVAAEAGDHMDFAVVHTYEGHSDIDLRRLPTSVPQVDETIRALDDFFRRKFGSEVPIALTEWNVNKRAQLRGMAAGVMLGELIGRYVEANVDRGAFWPLRFPGDYGFRALLDHETKNPQPMYHVMRLFSSNLTGTLLESKTSTSDLYSIASLEDRGKKLTVFIINKPIIREPRSVEIKLEGFAVDTARAVSLQAKNPMDDTVARHQKELTHLKNNKYACRIPPFSILMIEFSGKAPH